MLKINDIKKHKKAMPRKTTGTIKKYFIDITNANRDMMTLIRMICFSEIMDVFVNDRFNKP